MRKLILPLFLLTLGLNLAACSTQGVAAPTNAPALSPTSAPIARPTSGPTSNPVSPAGNELGGPAWKWAQSIAPGGTATNISDSGRYTVQFQSDGRVGIATKCQSATGSYTTDGHALQIKLESMTNAVCPGDKLSGQFIAELGGVTSYHMDGGDLVLDLGAAAGSLRMSH
jgi:heat shock protein HslJ